MNPTDEVLYCPRCGEPMQLMGENLGDLPYFECFHCGYTQDVRG